MPDFGYALSRAETHQMRRVSLAMGFGAVDVFGK